MHERHQWVRSFLAAVKSAAETYPLVLASPRNPRLIKPIFEAALKLDEAGEALQCTEISRLGVELVFATKMRLLLDQRGDELGSVISRLLDVASDFAHSRVPSK